MSVCPVCHLRKAKRSCPALGKQICAVCCGTKRLVEIACPDDCGYLASARSHPPAVVQRQVELDRAMFLPVLQGLSERQARVLLTLAAVVAGHEGEMLQKVTDEDIVDAAGAHPATLETTARGILYEHQPASLPAARLMTDLKAAVGEVVKASGAAIERDAAVALRRVEHAGKMMVQVRPGGDELRQLFNRLLIPVGADKGRSQEPPAQGRSLIIPYPVIIVSFLEE